MIETETIPIADLRVGDQLIWCDKVSDVVRIEENETGRLVFTFRGQPRYRIQFYPHDEAHIVKRVT